MTRDEPTGTTDESAGGSDGRAASTTGGTYTLVIDLPEPTVLSVGALGDHRFAAGAYAYTGSALGTGGFARVDRHRRVAAGEHDVRHWHVDHLLGHSETRIDRVIESAGADVECVVAGRLPEGPVDGFGSSDCGCVSHLSTAPDVGTLADLAVRAHGAATE